MNINGRPVDAEAGAAFPTAEEVERRHFERALRASGGDIKAAARLLGVARNTVYRRLERWGLRAPR